jgi:hypothetical protein
VLFRKRLRDKLIRGIRDLIAIGAITLLPNHRSQIEAIQSVDENLIANVREVRDAGEMSANTFNETLSILTELRLTLRALKEDGKSEEQVEKANYLIGLVEAIIHEENGETFVIHVDIESEANLFLDETKELKIRMAKDRLVATGHPQLTDLFIFTLKNKKGYHQFSAIIELKDIGDVKAIPYIEKEITNSDPRISVAAIEALGKLESKQSLPIILTALGKDFLIDDTIFEVVFELGDASNIPDVKTYVSEHQSNSSIDAMPFIIKFASTRDIPFFIGLLEQQDPCEIKVREEFNFLQDTIKGLVTLDAKDAIIIIEQKIERVEECKEDIELARYDKFGNVKTEGYQGFNNIRNLLLNALVQLTGKHRLYIKEGISFHQGRRHFPLRRKFEKTGNETTILGNQFANTVIVKYMPEDKFLFWKMAFEFEGWKRVGFSHIPIEPILRYHKGSREGELRVRRVEKEGQVNYIIFTGVLPGMSVSTYYLKNRDDEIKFEINRQINAIIAVMGYLNIEHGDLHEGNFVVVESKEGLQVYLIDFDDAREANDMDIYA